VKPETQILPLTSLAANEYEALPSYAGEAPPLLPVVALTAVAAVVSPNDHAPQACVIPTVAWKPLK